MEPLKVEEILKATKGKLVNFDRQKDRIRGISTDSRTLKRGQLFVALRGLRCDGHTFTSEAFKRGAKLALVSKDLKIKKPFIKVKDTLKALGDISCLYRTKFNVAVIGITGSNGKTTTKQLLSHLLASKFNVIASSASFNNLVGVPLTLVRIKKDTRIVVQEMETNVLGGIKRLCDISHPYVGIVTNIGPTHLEFLKTEYGVFKEKSELLSSLPSGGFAVLNIDDGYFARLKQVSQAKRVITFGVLKAADFKATKLEIKDDYLYFTLNSRFRIRLNTFFYKNIYNALAAIAVSVGVFDLKMKDVVRLLEDFDFLPLRAELVKIGNIRIINDSFNANPDSTKDALLTLKRMRAKRKLALLGDMLELGRSEEPFHRQVGNLCAELDLDGLVCVGASSRFIAHGALAKGMPSYKIIYCKNNKEAVKSLMNILKPFDALLVKGSRAMRLELVVEELKHIHRDG